MKENYMNREEVFKHYSHILDTLIDDTLFYKYFFQNPFCLNDDIYGCFNKPWNIHFGATRACVEDETYPYVIKTNLQDFTACEDEEEAYRDAVNEGLENRLYDALYESHSYEEYLSNAKSKRYTLSRIKRICIYILLGITKDLKNNLQNVDYARILKINNESKELLNMINKNCKNSIITKITDDSLSLLDASLAESLKLDILANNISHNITHDYTNKIIC